MAYKASILDGDPMVIATMRDSKYCHVLTRRGNDLVLELIDNVDEHLTGVLCFSEESAARNVPGVQRHISLLVVSADKRAIVQQVRQRRPRLETTSLPADIMQTEGVN